MAMTEDALERLLAEAVRAMDLAYAPYSRYPVGAAILLGNGETVVGANIENASYPVSLCAERAAVAHALAHGRRDLMAVAVASGSHPPAPPCGACRQVLSEFNPTMTVVVGGAGGIWRRYRLDQLLPESFGPGHVRHGV
jgi:cytidine deaminase